MVSTLIPNNQRKLNRRARGVRSNAGAPISTSALLPARMADRQFHYSQWTKLGNYGFGSINHYYAMTFALADLPNAQESEFAAIYKQYRIDRVTVKFVPYCTTVTGGDWMANPADAAVVHQSLVSVAVDYNDNVAPANEAAVLEYENVQLHPSFGQPWEISLVPRAKLDTNNVNSVPVASPWIDTANTGVTHYGLKLCVPQIGGDVETVEGLHAYVRYDVTFRTVH